MKTTIAKPMAAAAISPPDVNGPRPLGPAFEAAYASNFDAWAICSTRLMRIFALALELPEAVPFDGTNRQPQSAVPQPALIPHSRTALKDGQLAPAGAHTDYGSLTSSNPTERWDGLQVRNRGGRSGSTVPTSKHGFVVNIANLMNASGQRPWILDTAPRDQSAERYCWRHQRQSLVFFHQAPITTSNGRSACKLPGKDEPQTPTGLILAPTKKFFFFPKKTGSRGGPGKIFSKPKQPPWGKKIFPRSSYARRTFAASKVA